MKKTVLILLVMSVISCFTGNSGSSIKPELVEIQNEINRNCPIMVDREGRLDNVTALSGNSFQYNYTFINYDAESVSVDNVLALKPKILEGYRSNPQLKWITEGGVTVTYSYSGRDGRFIGSFVITPEEYRFRGSNLTTPLRDEYKSAENLKWKPQDKILNSSSEPQHVWDLLSILNSRVDLGDDEPSTLESTFPYDFNGDNHLDYLFFLRYENASIKPMLLSGRAEQLIEFNNRGEDISFWGLRIDVINFAQDGELYLVLHDFDFGNAGGSINSFLYQYQNGEYVIQSNDKLIEEIANSVNYEEKDMLFKVY